MAVCAYTLLSFIFVLHQTTTIPVLGILTILLSFIFVLHQTTTTEVLLFPLICCLLSLFYIKPQLLPTNNNDPDVVFYLCSTSNHNSLPMRVTVHGLSFIFVLHQTTTIFNLQWLRGELSFIFVLHQTTTWLLMRTRTVRLSFIFVLHQTTTVDGVRMHHNKLSFIFVLHQTTTWFSCISLLISCLLSLFYIKPQLSA